MQRMRAMIGLASLVGAALVAGPASALTAYSPTGHLNVRSGPVHKREQNRQHEADHFAEVHLFHFRNPPLGPA